MLAQRVSEWTNEWKQQGWIEGMEKGMEKGIEAEKILLIRQIRRRFGHAIADTAKIFLSPVMDTDTLEQIGDWVVDCDDGDALLTKLKAL